MGFNKEKLNAAKKELAAFGEVKPIRVDLTKWDEVESTMKFIAELEKVDLLVNAAGVFVPKPFVDHDVEDYEKYLSLNKATFFITQGRFYFL